MIDYESDCMFVYNELVKVGLNQLKEACIVIAVEYESAYTYSHINQAALADTVLDRACLGKHIEDVHQEPFLSLLKDALHKVEMSGSVVELTPPLFELFKLKEQGTVQLIPIKNKQNVIEFIFCISSDKHSLMTKTNKMKEEIQRFKSVIDHNMDGIISLNMKKKIVSSNPSACAILGYTEKALKNRSFKDIINEYDNEQFQEKFNETVKGHALETFCLKIILKNGKQLNVLVKTVPIVVDDRINGIFVIFRDISRELRNSERIQHMMYYDEVTGLKNKNALLRDMQGEMAAGSREKAGELGILYIDLDRFKRINDLVGHAMGDRILKQVGERLQAIKQEKYEVYRLGADEFVILLFGTDYSKTSSFTSNIFLVFREPFWLEEQEYFITPSIGISMFPFDGYEVTELLGKAENALYEVKKKGKAHFQFYSPELNRNLHNFLTMEEHLRKALEKDELILYLQPQIDLKTEKVTSFEALLRWNSSELGFVSPADFIPMAEETGLIFPIGEWVLEEVCRIQKSWQDKGYPLKKIDLNLSPKQFLQPGLKSILQALLLQYDVNPACVGIEITEGAMQNTEETLKLLNELKEIGISIAVDDFGTGYSSLSYIKNFPLDSLKIDRSFINELLVDHRDAAIITTIIHLAQSLGIEVIAEGVETKEQAVFLQACQCEKAQGFFYSKPLPIKEIETVYFSS